MLRFLLNASKYFIFFFFSCPFTVFSCFFLSSSFKFCHCFPQSFRSTSIFLERVFILSASFLCFFSVSFFFFVLWLWLWLLLLWLFFVFALNSFSLSALSLQFIIEAFFQQTQNTHNTKIKHFYSVLLSSSANEFFPSLITYKYNLYIFIIMYVAKIYYLLLIFKKCERGCIVQCEVNTNTKKKKKTTLS